ESPRRTNPTDFGGPSPCRAIGRSSGNSIVTGGWSHGLAVGRVTPRGKTTGPAAPGVDRSPGGKVGAGWGARGFRPSGRGRSAITGSAFGNGPGHTTRPVTVPAFAGSKLDGGIGATAGTSAGGTASPQPSGSRTRNRQARRTGRVLPGRWAAQFTR